MSTLNVILIITLPFQLSTLQLFIRYMKNVHYALINFYYSLVSGIGYLLWVIVQYGFDDDILTRFTLRNVALLIVASISHVGALVFWT